MKKYTLKDNVISALIGVVIGLPLALYSVYSQSEREVLTVKPSYEVVNTTVVQEQSRDRIHRTGQTNKCSYIHLLTKSTVEVDIYRALAGYSDFSEKLFTEYMDGYRRSYSQ